MTPAKKIENFFYCRLNSPYFSSVKKIKFVVMSENAAPYYPAVAPAFDVDVITETQKGYTLIVWNDEVNTFEWVISTLIEICGHSQEQAEQCAMLIHTKGKYGVKNGSYDDLKPQCDAITERLIGATIEILAT